MVLQDADTSSMLQLEDYSILPSTFLPPIRKICDLSSRNLVKLVTILADIYTPDVFGTKSEAVHSPRSNFSGNRQLMPHSERLEKGNEENQSSEYEGMYSVLLWYIFPRFLYIALRQRQIAMELKLFPSRPLYKSIASFISIDSSSRFNATCDFTSGRIRTGLCHQVAYGPDCTFRRVDWISG